MHSRNRRRASIVMAKSIKVRGVRDAAGRRAKAKLSWDPRAVRDKDFGQSDGKTGKASEQVSGVLRVTFLNNQSSCWVANSL